jgi:hypothetical protein
MEISVKFENIDRIAAAIAVTGRLGAIEAARALRHEAQEVLGNSLDEVPVDTGALKASARIVPETGVETKGDSVSVTISYGSTAEDYAVIVHEDLTAYHPHGKAKYLEGPLVRQLVGISDRIAAKVMRVQKGGIK